MKRVSRARVAPGPRGHWLLGNLGEFRRDVLGLLRESADRYGDIVRFRLGPRLIHLLNHPDYVAHVLQKNHANYDKQTRSVARLKSVCGESLLTGNGEFWQRQRGLLQPAFHRRHLAEFAAQMTSATASMLGQWARHAATGARVDGRFRNDAPDLHDRRQDLARR